MKKESLEQIAGYLVFIIVALILFALNYAWGGNR
mgnify:CR=1 FL=1